MEDSTQETAEKLLLCEYCKSLGTVANPIMFREDGVPVHKNICSGTRETGERWEIRLTDAGAYFQAPDGKELTLMRTLDALNALESNLARATEALRPFAAVKALGDDDMPFYRVDGVVITYGDLRRAQTALASLNERSGTAVTQVGEHKTVLADFPDMGGTATGGQ